MAKERRYRWGEATTAHLAAEPQASIGGYNSNQPFPTIYKWVSFVYLKESGSKDGKHNNIQRSDSNSFVYA